MSTGQRAYIIHLLLGHKQRKRRQKAAVLTCLCLRCWCCRYSNPETALNCGSVLRDCIRSAPIAKCAA